VKDNASDCPAAAEERWKGAVKSRIAAIGKIDKHPSSGPKERDPSGGARSHEQLRLHIGRSINWEEL